MLPKFQMYENVDRQAAVSIKTKSCIWHGDWWYSAVECQLEIRAVTGRLALDRATTYNYREHGSFGWRTTHISSLSRQPDLQNDVVIDKPGPC